MGTSASVVCSNPNKLTTKDISNAILLYTQLMYNNHTRKVHCNSNGADIKIDALHPTTEQEFQHILGMLDREHNIKIIKTNWWEFKILK